MSKDIITVVFDTGPMPEKCDHCCSENMVNVGLVAPKCNDCGRFSLSHMTPREVT
jgi:hypothetical protein